MFESRLLDKLSRVHPDVVPAIFVPTIAIFAVLALERLSVLEAVGCAIGGGLFWTLRADGIHRFVFHFEPEKGIGARLHWIIHGVHHDHPNDPPRLGLPPPARCGGSGRRRSACPSPPFSSCFSGRCCR